MDSVAYSEIDVVRERWGRPLLQIKDQKHGSKLSKRKTAKATLDIRAPSPSINDDVEDLNHCEVIHYAPEVAHDEENGIEDKSKPMEATCGLPRSVSNSYQLGATSLMNHELPSHSSYRFVPAPAPERQVRFGLLPAAEISSTPTRWNPGTKDIHKEKIQQICVALDHRHNV